MDANGRDPRWPDLRNAVHWVVDDTAWDHHDPAEDIGYLLESEGEADLARQLVDAFLGLEAVRPRSDQGYFEDPAWPEVRRRASALLAVMEGWATGSGPPAGGPSA